MALNVASALQGAQKVRFAELASTMIVIYDHAITLDQEVALIWRAQWSFGKCIFLLNRYYTLCAAIFNNYVLFGPGVSNDVSLHWFRWQGATGIIAFTLGELVLQLRLYALYNLNKRLLTIMVSIFMTSLVASTIIMSIALSRLHASSGKVFGVPICTLSNLAEVPYFYSFWIPIMISETILCALVILRACRRYHRRSTFMASGRELMTVLIRDSILYFLVLFVVYLTNTIIFIQNDTTNIECAVAYAVSMSCVMGNRLCLNVRGMVSRDNQSMSDIELDIRTLEPGATPESHLSPRTPISPSRRTPIIVFAHSATTTLSEHEMDDLRTMKAERPEV